MIVLPFPPRRASLQSFWLALCFMVTVLIGMLAWVNVMIALLGVPAVVLLGLAGVVWPHLATRPYRVWNRLARFYGKVAERLLLGICYGTVMVPAGWTETTLRLSRPEMGDSLWTLHRSLPTSVYKQLHSWPSGESAGENWISRYLAWAWSSKQPWLLALLPFLCILLWLKKEEESVVPESIYTLF